MSSNNPGGHRRQVKFSGLVGQGIVSPTASTAPPQFASDLKGTIVATDDGAQHLLPQAESAAIPTNWELVDNVVMDIPTDLVDDSPYQLTEDSRDRYNPEEIDELAHTLAAAGQQEPIKVRRVGNRFQLIAGHRRIRAARILGWTSIKALIVIMSDKEAELATMVHNEGRKGNCDYTKAKLYRRALERGFAKTQSDVAALFATKQSHVSRCQKMFALPAEILSMLDATPNLFSSTTSEVITQLVAEHPDQIPLIKQAVERIKEGAPENSIKGWISQKQSAQIISAKPKSTRPKVITDAGGRQLYTARLNGRVIELRLSAPDIDADQALENLIKYLKGDTVESKEIG